MLNEHLPEKQRLVDIDHMLQLMDFDGNGMVDINEFFEVEFFHLINYYYCILLYSLIIKILEVLYFVCTIYNSSLMILFYFFVQTFRILDEKFK